MAKICSVCGRVPQIAFSRSKSNIATKRRRMLNIQKRTIDGTRVMVCTSCLRTIKKRERAHVAANS